MEPVFSETERSCPAEPSEDEFMSNLVLSGSSESRGSELHWAQHPLPAWTLSGAGAPLLRSRPGSDGDSNPYADSGLWWQRPDNPTPRRNRLRGPEDLWAGPPSDPDAVLSDGMVLKSEFCSDSKLL
ncbi:hypothetical protein FQA47_017738 [Oryzias melastigma]|uniref:Uncharacterized protein n=1 Tax=Oryzias melastigma TaxID=30732 RepID=A0A834F9N3_ORYME|nr:hypothetical protein FQA47_017738 [Oryzias melastigma]